MRIKICGIKEKHIIELLITLNIDFAGMIFYKKSPRYISVSLAENFISEYSSKINFVGVFVDEPIESLKNIINRLNLKYIQLHGNESADYINSLPKVNIIKAFRMKDDFSKKDINDYKKLNLYGYLFDTFKTGKPGGTGDTFDWDKFGYLKNYSNVFISGGLNESNILDAINIFNPFVVDINSGVETSPGIKSPEKITNIVKRIRSIG